LLEGALMPDAETARRRFMKISDVVSETSLSRATIYRLIAKGNFPTPSRSAPSASHGPNQPCMPG
jgi:predicted DNA-binding transcriptional regulator AlpA